MSTSFNKSIRQNFIVSSSKIKCCLVSSTGVQGKALVSNSTSFSDITSKCISSTVPVTNTSCNINFDKTSYSFSKPIVKDMKYSSFKIEDPLPLQDGILSDGPDSSCIYKSKYDVATYRENAPHLSYSEKVDLIKNLFVPENNFYFPETTRSFKYEWLLLFPWLCYYPSEMHLTACLVFCLVMISLLKLLGLKIYFHSPSELGQVLFLNLKLIVKAKRRKLILHMNLFKAFIFQHGLNLKLFFLKSKAQAMKLIC